MLWKSALGDGASVIAGCLASDRGLRRAFLLWTAVFAVLGLSGVALRQIGPSMGLDPTLVALFMPGREWSLPSLFGYLTALSAAVALFARHRLSGRFSCLSWAIVLLAICLDDAFEYHETVGAMIASKLGMGSIFGLRGQDVGEVIAWALMGIVILPAMVSALSAADQATRQTHAVFFVLFGMLLAFAVGMDLAHILAPQTLQPMFGIVEDGGEIAVLGLMAAAAWALLIHERSAALCGEPRSRAITNAASWKDHFLPDTEVLTMDGERDLRRDAPPSA